MAFGRGRPSVRVSDPPEPLAESGDDLKGRRLDAQRPPRRAERGSLLRSRARGSRPSIGREGRTPEVASAQCCEQPRGVEVSIGRRDVTVTEAISQGPTTSHPPLGVALPWGTEGAP